MVGNFEHKLVQYINETKNDKATIGVFAIGHNSYWPQFSGLKDKLMKHYVYFVNKLKEVTKLKIIEYKEICDCYKEADKAGKYFSNKSLDLIICFPSTYATSVCASGVLSKTSAPVLLVCLQPSPGMDIDKATTELQLENDAITSLPEISNVVNRMNKPLMDFVVGVLYEDKRAWNKIKDWCKVADVIHKLKNDHIGLMGHVYEGMLDMNSDPTMFEGAFGMHVEHLEMEDLEVLVDSVKEDEIKHKIQEINAKFETPNPKVDPITSKVEKEDLIWPAKVSIGMDKLVVNYGLTGMAYYYRGLKNKFERLHAGMIIGNSLLTGKGIAMAGELDLKNVVAMLITDRFDAGGSFAEIHPVDFRDDFVLVGHDGPHHIEIADSKPLLRKLNVFHGKRGSGPSVEYSIKVGPITILCLTQTGDGKFKMVVAEGESIQGSVPATGNTNTRGKFKPDIRTFLENWALEAPTHHFSLGIGQIGYKLEMVAKYLNINFSTATEISNPYKK